MPKSRREASSATGCLAISLFSFWQPPFHVRQYRTAELHLYKEVGWNRLGYIRQQNESGHKLCGNHSESGPDFWILTIHGI